MTSQGFCGSGRCKTGVPSISELGMGGPEHRKLDWNVGLSRKVYPGNVCAKYAISTKDAKHLADMELYTSLATGLERCGIFHPWMARLLVCSRVRSKLGLHSTAEHVNDIEGDS